MMNIFTFKKITLAFIVAFTFVCTFFSYGGTNPERKEKDLQELQGKFQWWPTDATPGPVKDEERGGYWWWPANPGAASPWGNRGYIYVYKIIFDYKEDELPPPKPKELRPSLLIKKIIKNVKIYFDYDKADLRADHMPILESAVKALKRNPEADILITGNCDTRGSEGYNQQLGKNRALTVQNFMIDKGLPDSRIRIISRGKLDAVAAVADIVGMQKDRNAQFMIAEVEEVMRPYPDQIDQVEAEPIEEGKYLIEQKESLESGVEVSVRPYIIKVNDSLWKIAEEQMGSGHRWKYLYEFNKDKIDDPSFLIKGTVINIPVESQSQAERLEKYDFNSQSLSKEPDNEFLDASLDKDPILEEENSVYQSQAPSSKSSRQYVIKKNDSLWKIAKQQLQDGNRWKEIYELNKDKIKDPNKLSQGKVIFIPAQ